MKITQATTPENFSARRGERGAALITALMVSMLLLAAGGAVILTSAMSTSLAADAINEEQAYVGAEAGLQASLNVLRGNVAPNPKPTADPAGSVADLNKLTFRRAVYKRDTGGDSSVPSSNKPSDTTATARLSRWLSYGNNATYPDRVVLGTAATYSPLNGTAYQVEVTDPENSDVVVYTVAGTFNNGSDTLTIGGATTATLKFEPAAKTTGTCYPVKASNLGQFRVTVTGLGTAIIPAGTTVSMTVTQEKPWAGAATFTGSVTGAVAAGLSTMIITWDAPTLYAEGTKIALTSPLNVAAPITAGGVTKVDAMITAPDPRKLIVRSTGLGPRGALKRLEMTVDKLRFNLEPPAPIVIRGADIPDGSTTAPEATFGVGSSNAKWYSGKDKAGKGPQKPTIAISLHDWSAGVGGLTKPGTVDDPKFAILDLDEANMSPWPAAETPTPPSTPPVGVTPDFLKTADKARDFVNQMASLAKGQGRYMTSLNGMAGDDSPYTPLLTFVDGDCTLSGGAGLLVVTGTLTLKGNDDFKGLILVLGEGKVERSGGGNGKIDGAWYVAKFNRTFPLGTESKKFLAPSFDVNGGGNGDFVWDSDKSAAANNLLGVGVVGIVEY